LKKLAHTSILGAATESQVANAQLLNALDYFRSELRESSEAIDTVMENCINPLVQAVADAIEAIIQTMHNENFQRYEIAIQNLSTFFKRDFISI